MGPMVLGIVITLLVFAAVFYFVRRKQQKAASLQNLRLTWGRPKIPPAKSELERIALYDKLKNRDGLDDKTWNDLDLDLIFEYIDRTSSRVGQQFLFHLLKNPHSNEEPLLKFEQVIHCVSNADLREQLQIELHRLSHQDALFLPYLFLAELPRFRAQRFVFLTLTVVTLASLAGAFFSPGFRVMAVLLVITNMFVSMYYRRRLEGFIQPLRLLNQLINTARRVAVQFESS